MNPYETSSQTTTAGRLKLNGVGSGLCMLGYWSLVPAMMFAALILCGTVVYSFTDKFSIPFRVRWPLAMSVSLVVFLFASLKLTHTFARLVTYVAGAATVFCAIVYDAFNAAELNAYTGNCGNPVMAGLMFRFACFSTYVGVPLITLAALGCLRSDNQTGRNDETSHAHEELDQAF